MKKSLNRMAGYFAAFAVLGAVIASLGPTLPYLALNVRISLSAAGILFSMRSIGYLAGSLISGRSYDRFPGHHLLSITLLLLSISMFLVPLSSSVWLLGVLIVIVGLTLGGTDVGSNTLTIWIYGSKSGPYLNALFFCGGLGGIIAPILVGLVYQMGVDVRWVYWIISGLILLPVVMLARQSSPVRKFDDSAIKISQTNRGYIGLFGILFFIYVGVEVSFGGWIFTFVTINQLGSAVIGALLTSIFWIAITIGRFIAIPLAARYSPSSIVAACLAGAFFSLAVILSSPDTLVVVGLGVLCLGLSIASISPTTLSLAQRMLSISGKMTGILWACGSLGAVVTPWFVGHLLLKYDPFFMILFLLAMVSTGTIVFACLLVFRSRSKNSRSAQGST